MAKPSYNLHVADSGDGVAANLFAWLRPLVAAKPDLHIAVSGGSMVGLLGSVFAMAASGGEDWRRIRLALADERLVSLEDGESTQGAFRRLLSPELYARFAPPVDAAKSPEAAAKAYEAGLEGAALDVILLGLGPDGHTASLFPAHPVFEACLNSEASSPRYVGVCNSPKPPPNRISLSLAAIAATPNVAFVTSGAAKAPVLDEMLTKGPESSLPIAHVKSATGSVHIFADAAALPGRG